MFNFSVGSKITFYAQSMPNSVDVEEAAKSSIKFSNGVANYSVFEKKYNDNHGDVKDENIAKTWQGRKYWAIPNMGGGITKTICHLALAIMFCFKGKSLFNLIKEYTFCAIRDIEEVYGNFITIFNDKLGLYHIQQAQFQKRCYHEQSWNWLLELQQRGLDEKNCLALGLTANATIAEIRSQYKALSMKHHPDRHSSQNPNETTEQHRFRREYNQEKFQLIASAHQELLKSPYTK